MARHKAARESVNLELTSAVVQCIYERGARRTPEELHHLVDQLPEDEVQPALELIRGRVAQHGGQGRDLPFFASFEAAPDLAERAEEILSAELGR
ncbi:MAG: hypothetical protein ACRDOH_01120 [Streptosporangiaceae bacterium]